VGEAGSLLDLFFWWGGGGLWGNWSRFLQEGVLYTIVSTRAALAPVPRIIKLFIFLKIFIFEKKNVSEYFKRFFNFLHFFFLEKNKKFENFDIFKYNLICAKGAKMLLWFLLRPRVERRERERERERKRGGDFCWGFDILCFLCKR